MSINYYDHEIRVKIIDGVLSHEQNWEWFIQHTEENFDTELTADSLEDALISWQEIRDVFYYLVKIHEVANTPLPISQPWLKEVDLLAQFYNGTIDLCNTPLSSNFSIVMRLLIYAGKIHGQIKNKSFFYYSDIFKLRNLALLENINLFVTEEEKILQLIDAAPSILKNERKVFLDNINGIILPADPEFLDRHQHEFYDANCFSFSTIKDDNIRVWEERELLDMLSVSVNDGKIVPRISWGETFSPDYTLWTKDLISHIKSYFDSPVVTFVVETIGYLLHGDVPSADTINKHFALLYELSEKAEENYAIEMSCSSLEIIRLLFSRKLKDNITADSYKKYTLVLNKLYNNDCKYLLRELLDSSALTDKNIIHKLHEEIILTCDKVEMIKSFSEFTHYIDNKFIRGTFADRHFDVLSQKFDTIVDELDNVRISYIFLSYFEFLLKIKSNKEITAIKISFEILRIRKLWQEQYYTKSCQGMQIIKTTPILIPEEYSGHLLNYILLAPSLFASQQMILKDSELISTMQTLSDSPFTILTNKILISNDFPSHPIFKLDEKHPVDVLYGKNVNRIRETYTYKFRNNFTSNQYTSSIFEIIKKKMQISLSLIKDIQPLYKAVEKQNPEYVFLSYPKDLCLAHLTQLFPIFENKIREFGELFGIVPVRENLDECHRLKEPDTVLKLIIQYILEMGGNLEDVSDLYYVHFCMFGENGMNIRNNCIHGVDYCQGDQLKLGFTITLISLYMIGWRMQLILDNMTKEKSQNPTDENQESLSKANAE